MDAGLRRDRLASSIERAPVSLLLPGMLRWEFAWSPAQGSSGA